MKIRRFETSQNLPVAIEEAWSFLSDPRNLKAITPPYMGFDIQFDPLPEEMYAGMIISYRVRPVARIPVTWVTEITHIRRPHYFVDEQRFGPYTFWHHQHHLRSIESGVEMKDIVHFKVPGAFLGDLLVPWVVLPKLREIFSYRREKLIERFGDFPEFR